MFLVRYAENYFVDAERITHIAILKGGEVSFSMHSEESSEYIVTKEYAERFLNQVQVINRNADSVQRAYIEANEA